MQPRFIAVAVLETNRASVSDNTDVDIHLIERALADMPGPRRILVGLSGGLDSIVLLCLVRQWWLTQAPAQRPALHAIHVNHQLMPQADAWQARCVTLCAEWQVELTARKVVVESDQSSLEASAREARYSVFKESVEPGDILMLAHHRDDQVETVLQRLARGSGPLGLGGMALHSRLHGFSLLRPLLDIDREQLQAFASDHQLSWMEDPSNQDETLERNYIRHRLLPVWRDQRPQLNQSLARSARLSQESAQLLDELAALDMRGQPQSDGGLPISILQELSCARQKNLLRYWLRQQGIRPPSEIVTQRILEEVLGASADGQPQVAWGQSSVRRFQATLYGLATVLPQPAGLQLRLDTFDSPQSLPLGCLISGVGESCFSRQAMEQAPVTVRFRSGGERLKLQGRPPKALKDLFQESGVPPWLRGVWPILYSGGSIAGLPGLWVCEGFLPQSEEDKICFHWHRNAVAQD